MQILKKHYKEISIVLIILIMIPIIYFVFNDDKEKNIVIAQDLEEKNIVDTIPEPTSSLFVDVKGAVKKPGVYELKLGTKVIDAISSAGGLTKSANTQNINLSAKLKDEMVIYVFTDNEIKKGSKVSNCATTCTTNIIEVNNCVDKTTQTTSKAESKPSSININTATKEELMSISGIGESKANDIINYRKSNPFKTIDEIKNVSGIGDAIFAKIKDFITV